MQWWLAGGRVTSGDRNVDPPSVALVTGASRFLGGYLVTRLAQNPDIDRVIAVDTQPPSKDMQRRMGRAEFVLADIRNPLVGKVIRNMNVDTVVHASAVTKAPKSGSRVAMKDMNVFGAMQLFAVCQKAPSVRKVVLRSSSAVYGSSAKDPAKFTEEMSARHRVTGAFAHDMIEIEGYLRGLARRRSDIDTTILRLAPTVGHRLPGSVSSYLTSPLVPTVLGRDPRMQLLHEEDALGALERATVAGPPGTFNVAGDGIVTMSQAVRRAGGATVPMPYSLFRTVGHALMGSVMKSFTKEELDYFHFGCGLDTTRMRSELGFEPRWSTRDALDDFAHGIGLTRVVRTEWIDKAESMVLSALGEKVDVR
ncbi:NAD-dependent epimerase/dehydratase family protein [Rhodococcus yananensis]|uniref:NAD-dependent epimerase/dehydratase family protein n=1 Tax=Rhodococcus yananensis TaxID=2879464 RepID=UPI001CF8E88E|nr:NAD-dependent epimerase/dehydratase family protein [Rhodococcus yananensis]